MPTIDIVTGQYSEFEWDLRAVSPAVNTDIYTFRITSAGAQLDTISVTPQWTVGTAAGAPSTSSRGSNEMACSLCTDHLGSRTELGWDYLALKGN